MKYIVTISVKEEFGETIIRDYVVEDTSIGMTDNVNDMIDTLKATKESKK